DQSVPERVVPHQVSERLHARDRTGRSERGKVGFAGERRFQQLVILSPRNLDRAERLEVIGDELRIEQLETAGPQPRGKVDERDLGCIARAVKHALAEERATKRDAVEPADQCAALVHFETVTMATLVELAVEDADAAVNPGARPSRTWLGAAFE